MLLLNWLKKMSNVRGLQVKPFYTLLIKPFLMSNNLYSVKFHLSIPHFCFHLRFCSHYRKDT